MNGSNYDRIIISTKYLVHFSKITFVINEVKELESILIPIPPSSNISTISVHGHGWLLIWW